MKKPIFILALFCATCVLFSSCEKDDPDEPNQEELITTVNYTLSPAGGGDAIVLTFTDLDGDGGNDAVIQGGTLAANTTYAGSIELLNESESPAEDITAEIDEEREEHQFFFESTVSGLSIAYTDQDANGMPVGLANSISTGNAGSGNIKVTLRHEPVKDAVGVADGDISNASGETDIEVTFPIDVL